MSTYLYLPLSLQKERDKIINTQPLLIIYQVPRTAYTSSHSTYHSNTRRQLFWLPCVMGWTVAPQKVCPPGTCTCELIWKKNLCWCNEVRGLERRHLGLSGCALILIRREGTHMEVKTTRRLGQRFASWVTCLQPGTPSGTSSPRSWERGMDTLELGLMSPRTGRG